MGFFKHNLGRQTGRRLRLLANGADTCGIAAGVFVVTVRLVLEPLRSPYDPSLLPRAFPSLLARGFFWPVCRNRPHPRDYRQRRSLLGYASGHAGFDRALIWVQD
jgi:hypothetical protein